MNSFRLVNFGFILAILLSSPVSAYEIKLDYLGLDNQYYSFDSFEGQFLLVDTMATWCGPCILAMPHLKEVQELRKDVLTVFSLSVSPSSDTPEELADFKKKQNATWEFGIDYDLKFQDAYDVIYIPTYFLFDPNGNLVTTFNSTNVETTLDYLNQIDPYLPPGDYVTPKDENQPLFSIPEVKLAIATVLLTSLIVVLIRMIRKIKELNALKEN
ncbi:MAG: TlpA family protein disulfide reductase [Methanobacteriota archaeon]|nr:MAG: TlpA family protein disulfide reductase [Euryarchaeota archaeon]